MSVENGWAEWSKHVLLELERLGKQSEHIETKINELQVTQTKSIAELDTKVTQLQADVTKLKGKNGSSDKDIGETKGKLAVWNDIWMYLLTAGVIASIFMKFWK